MKCEDIEYFNLKGKKLDQEDPETKPSVKLIQPVLERKSGELVKLMTKHDENMRMIKETYGHSRYDSECSEEEAEDDSNIEPRHLKGYYGSINEVYITFKSMDTKELMDKLY